MDDEQRSGRQGQLAGGKTDCYIQYLSSRTATCEEEEEAVYRNVVPILVDMNRKYSNNSEV
jgi:hypothetical protein